ncbi:hypothetical protein OKW27_002030 [Paraburkholderia sp. 35.1]
MRAATGGSDPTLRLALWVRSRHMRSASVFRVCTMSSRLRTRSKPDDNESVARSLRETPIRSAAFLVSMTGDAVSQRDIARLFDVYLHKPFSCEALMQVIEDARCSSDANTRQAAWTNCCRRKRTQPMVGGSTASVPHYTGKSSVERLLRAVCAYGEWHIAGSTAASKLKLPPHHDHDFSLPTFRRVWVLRRSCPTRRINPPAFVIR